MSHKPSFLGQAEEDEEALGWLTSPPDTALRAGSDTRT
jgi:hypothetical protein